MTLEKEEAVAKVVLKPYGSAEREERMFGHIAEVRNPHCHSEEDLAKAIRDADVLIADVDIRVTKEVLKSAQKLRGIMACSIGVDYIDVRAATEAGIYVANMPDYCTNAVAEFAIGLIFSLARQIPQGIRATRAGNWEERQVLTGHELLGKQLGLVGFGKIGRALGEKGLGLGMQVTYYDPYVTTQRTGQAYRSVSSLPNLLATSDIVSLHAPLTEKTKNLISFDELSKMKKTAILVNVARGGIVDESDLLRALSEKQIAGAALDVLAIEPPMESDSLLLSMNNVIVTPHIAWNTYEAKANAEQAVARQVRQMLNGKPPSNLVNRQVLERKDSH